MMDTIFLQDGDGGLALSAGDVVADVEVEADVLAEFQDGIELVHLGQVVGVVVEADPDLVLVGKRGDAGGEDGGALGGDGAAGVSLIGVVVDSPL